MSTTSRYILGNYTFDTIDEYWEAQQDMKKIDVIRRELDVWDPEVASRLYSMIREGEIAFASPIGAEFTDSITDVLADNTAGLLDDKHTVDTAGKKVRKQRYIGATVICLAIAFGIYFGSSQLGDILTARNLESLAMETRQAEVDAADRIQVAEANAEVINAAAAAEYEKGSPNPFNPTNLVSESQLKILPEFTNLVSQNPDVKGWLNIEGMNIDYPVMQRPADNDYYLNRGFDGNEDGNGSLFMDYRCSIVNPTENTIIYGHNMNSGMMFGDLKKYLERSYFENHKKVTFKTLYEDLEYEVVAVCLSKVSNVEDKDFRYYDFTDATSQAQWDAFVENLGHLSVYSTTVDVKPSDRLLTLSTCNDYTEDGRLFLVAKCVSK